AFERRLFLARVDSDLAKQLLKGDHFRGGPDGAGVRVAGPHGLDPLRDFGPQLGAGGADVNASKHDGPGPKAQPDTVFADDKYHDRSNRTSWPRPPSFNVAQRPAHFKRRPWGALMAYRLRMFMHGCEEVGRKAAEW